MWGQRNQSDRTIRRIESITSLEDSHRKGSLMSESVVQLSENTFDEEISSATEPILVDFWAEWCGPCKMIAPILEELAVEQDGVLKIAKVNVDDAPGLAQRFEVMSIPTLILFKDGEPTKRVVGAKGKDALLDELSTFI
jgi:thioredoxin 1